MSASSRVSKAFENALCLPLNRCSKYILFSDCHRGAGSANDNFLKNEFLYLAALKYYFCRGFTYIELGDGDELWENRSISRIKEAHSDSFEMIARYDAGQRLYSLYGNHDMEKKDLLHSGIILKDMERRKDIYLTHGHQADILNSTLWPLARFLVRYVWKPLEQLGIPDPTSAAKNNTRKKKSEQRLTRWACENDHILITGHTHHPMIGTPESPYCNTGSCVHPSGITGIEIENRCMTLVKWSIGTRNDLSLYAMREVLGETVCVDDY